MNPSCEEKNKAERCPDAGKLIRIGIAAALAAASFLPFLPSLVRALLCAAAYAIVGLPVLLEAVGKVLHGEVFHETLLMSVASVGALCIGEFFEAAAVMILYSIGELLSERAADNSRRSIVGLLELRPETVLKKDGENWIEMPPESVHVGDVLRIRPGDRIGLDGEVTAGTSYIDNSPLTGESELTEARPGDRLLSGAINKNGLLEMRVCAEYGQSTASRIIALVRDTASQKSRSEQFITKFSRYYTPAVAVLAVLTAVLLPVSGRFTYAESVYAALNFLIIACPCALVISVPLAYFMGIGAAARQGLLIKGGNFLEALNHIETVVFDKTGTLTEGRFQVSRCLCANGMTQEQLLKLAAAAEAGSVHPVAGAIVEACGRVPEDVTVESVEEIGGSGVIARLAQGTLRVGTRQLLNDGGVSFLPPTGSGTSVFVALDDRYLGCIFLSDQLKKSAGETLVRLKKAGVKRILMLTGDNGQNAARVAGKLGITEVRGGLLPAEKADVMRELLARRLSSKRVVFVGDGINDAPSLAIADVGIAMGALGSDAAIEAADAVLMHGELYPIADAVRTAGLTRRIVMENIVVSLAVKLTVMLLALFGKSAMTAAVAADVGVTLLAVANTLRLYAVGKKKRK